MLIPLVCNIEITTMRKLLQFKTFAILMACVLSAPLANAQDYDDIWEIDGVQYKYYAGEAMVVGCDVDDLDVPPEVNLAYEDNYGDLCDRIVPVSIIGNSAFNDSWIGTVDLGKNVTALYYHSFYNCSYLSDIVCRSTTPPSVNSAFSSDMYSRVTLHVPSSALSAYKNHSEWKKFTNIVAITTEWSVDINSTNFPDYSFRSYLLSLYPKGYLTHRDIQRCTTLNIQNKGIGNSKGIEFFTELEELKCWNNSFSSLNLSSNRKLTYLDCAPNSYLTSLNVNNCTELKTLICYGTSITSLSVGNCSALEVLNCHETPITSLSVTGKENLTTIRCYNCKSLDDLRCWGNHKLTTLDVSGCTALTYLDCAPDHSLAYITGLGDCTALKKLYCRDCALTDLRAVQGMNDLEYLSCFNNKLKSLTVTNKSKLTTILCYGNTNMKRLDACFNGALTYLDCQNCTAMDTLFCYDDNLSTLSVRGCTALGVLCCYENPNLATITGLGDCTAVTYLDCEDCAITDLSAVNSMTNIETLLARNNKLSSLTITNKSKLTRVRAHSNPKLINALIYNNSALASLYLQNCTSLTQVFCYDNALTYLNVTDNTAMTFLSCSDNRLSSLNLQGCDALKSLYCYSNNISGTGMTTLVNSLPTRTESSKGSLYVLYNTGEHNSMTAEQITTARNKYWLPARWVDGVGWVAMTASTRGDVDGDGNVSISDLTGLIDMLLSGNTTGNAAADCDGDGSVSIADVTTLIDYLLKGSW